MNPSIHESQAKLWVLAGMRISLSGCLPLAKARGMGINLTQYPYYGKSMAMMIAIGNDCLPSLDYHQPNGKTSWSLKKIFLVLNQPC